MSTTLPVVERFHSIQGEGVHSGRSAFFIRLAKCKVGCSWCDTKESWSSSSYPLQTVELLANEAIEARSKGAAFLVITGGEPLHHNLEPLCEAVKTKSYVENQKYIPIHIETSGVDKLSGSFDWITVSPKRHFPPRNELLQVCHEIKIVIHTKEDILFAEEIEALTNQRTALKRNESNKKVYPKPLLFLQPGWDNEEGKKLAIQYVMKNPEWKLSLQTHKWLKIN